jgi:hypothetical protein
MDANFGVGTLERNCFALKPGLADLLLVWCRDIDRRAILPPLDCAILDSFHVRYGVGQPNSDTDQQCDDDHRHDVHHHAMPVIDMDVLVLVLCEIVELIHALIRHDGLTSRLPSGVAPPPEFQNLPDLAGFART